MYYIRYEYAKERKYIKVNAMVKLMLPDDDITDNDLDWCKHEN